MPISAIAAAEELFAEFPEWRALARTETATDGEEYLVIEVAPPQQAKVEHGLVIDTSNGEVTVGFDSYHSHFDDWVGDGEHFGTTAAIEFIKQIISERTAVVSWWQGTQWRGSAQLEAGAKSAVPGWATEGQYDRVRIRSWLGSLNADTDA
jgi:hypothetical protein